MIDFILKIFTPFVKFFGNVYMPFSRKKISGEVYYRVRDRIEIGAVLLTKTRGEFSNYINPVKIKHAAIYIGRIYGDDVCYVAEATGKGVVFTDLVTFLTTKDVLIISYPIFIRKDVDFFNNEIQKAVKLFKGIRYDYLFQNDKKAFYCFELVATCFKSVYPEVQLKVSEIIKGKRIYDADTFFDSRFFKIMFDSRVEK